MNPKSSMNAKARDSELDLEALGQRMVARRKELKSGAGPKPRGACCRSCWDGKYGRENANCPWRRLVRHDGPPPHVVPLRR